MKRILYSIFFAMVGFLCGVIYIIYRCGYILENKQRRADKYFLYFKFFDRWLTCKEQDYNFADYFNRNNIETVAIYGMGRIGNHLKYELKKAGIKIDYVIDEGENVIYGEEMHYNLRDKLPMTDIVIITPIDEYEEIKNRILDNNRMLKVVSVNEVVE